MKTNLEEWWCLWWWLARWHKARKRNMVLCSNFIYYIRCPWFLLERSMTTHLGRGSWKRSLVWFVIFFCGGVYAAFKSLTRLTFDQRSMTSLCSFHQQLSELISKAWITFDTLAAEFGINATKLLLWRSFVSDNFRAADVVVVNNNVYLSKINPCKCLIRRHWQIAKNLLFSYKE